MAAKRDENISVTFLNDAETENSTEKSDKGRFAKLVQFIPIIVGLVTAAVAVATVIVSFYQWLETRNEERFERAVVRVSSKEASERIAGVALLRTFLRDQNARVALLKTFPRDRNTEQHTQILSLLTHSLASEPDSIVRGAMVGLFKSIDTKVVKKEALNDALLELADMSRTVREQRELLATNESIATAISAVLRKGGRTDDLSNIFCVECNISGVNLGDVNLNGAILNIARLEKTYLNGAHLEGADLNGVKLNEANLNGANLRGADLRGSADLSGAHLLGAILRRAWLTQAKLYEADLRGADLRGADLGGADLRRAKLYGADLTPPNPGQDDRETNLSGADLTNAKLPQTKLRDANLWNANLKKACLRGAKLYEADLRGADLVGANLSEAILKQADLRPADVTPNNQSDDPKSANLWRAILIGANLTEAQLQGANLTEAQLQGANLTEAKLQRADFRGATLIGAILRGTDLSQVKNLTADQLSKAKTVYEATLPPEIEEELKRTHENLLTLASFNSSSLGPAPNGSPTCSK